MAGTVVEYTRFVEGQQRRARIIEELERPLETPAPRTRPAAVHPCIDIGEFATPVDASTTRGTVDGRPT